MTKWNKEKFEKLKARALGTYQFTSSGQFGSDGPGPEDIGYVIIQDVDLNEMDSRGDIIYKMVFEDYPGTYYIGFDYTGTFEPYQKPLFTTEK